MSGNTLLIVCEPCMKATESDYGFKLAGRNLLGCYQPYGPAQATKQLTAWLKKHSRCGGKGHPDHFVLAHAGERDYDQPKPKLIEVATTLPRVN